MQPRSQKSNRRLDVAVDAFCYFLLPLLLSDALLLRNVPAWSRPFVAHALCRISLHLLRLQLSLGNGARSQNAMRKACVGACTSS